MFINFKLYFVFKVESGHVSTNETTLRHVNKILKNHSYYNKKYANQENDQEQAVNEDEENYDDDENELLLNKSEFLLNENNLNNNSPNNNSSDLMAIMMMTLNGDHLSLGGGGASSSLATTALPTIITPFYVTDNENFNYAHNQKSPNSKMKHFRSMNSKKYITKNQKSKKQSNKNRESDNKDETSLVSQSETVAPGDDALAISQNQTRRRRRNINNSDSPKIPLKTDLILTQDSTFTKDNTDDSELPTNSNSKENTQNTIEILSSSPTKINPKIKFLKASTRKRNRQNLNKIRVNQISQAQVEVAQGVPESNVSKAEATGHDSANKSTQVELPFDLNKQKRITKMLQSTINLYNHFSTSVETSNPNKEKSWGSQLVLTIPADSIENTKLKSAQKAPASSLEKTDSRTNDMESPKTTNPDASSNSNIESSENVIEGTSNQNVRYKGKLSWDRGMLFKFII